MKTKEIIWVPNPSYVIGKYNVVVNEPISMELHKSLRALLISALDVRAGDKDATCMYFVSFIAVNLLLPVRVRLIPHAFVD